MKVKHFDEMNAAVQTRVSETEREHAAIMRTIAMLKEQLKGYENRELTLSMEKTRLEHTLLVLQEQRQIMFDDAKTNLYAEESTQIIEEGDPVPLDMDVLDRARKEILGRMRVNMDVTPLFDDDGRIHEGDSA